MKKLYLYLPVLLFPAVCFAQARWDGEAMNGQWNDPLNWVGDVLPASDDEVLLDHSIVIGNYTVELPPGNVSVELLRLVLSPAAPDSIRLILPVSNTSVAALVLTGSGNALVLKNCALFINNSGAASGTPVSVSGAGFFRIENGGHYIHQTERGHTMGLVSQLAGDAGTEAGIFEFNVPGAAAYTVSVSNRVYGHLVFSSGTPGTIKTYTGAGVNPLQIRSHLYVRRDAVFSYGSNVSSIQIRGDCIVDTGGHFNIANGVNNSVVSIEGNLHVDGRIFQTGTAAGSVLRMSGTQMQQITGKGTLTGKILLRIDNQQHVVVGDTLWLPADLDLLSGKLVVGENALLGIGAGRQVHNASEQSFVNGAIARVGEQVLLFPVGVGEIYAPLQLGAGGTATDTFIARYYRGNPQTISGPAAPVTSPIDHISTVEYWGLRSLHTASPRMVSLFAGPASFVQNPAGMLVAARQGNQWVSKGLETFEITGQQPPWTSGFVRPEEPATEYSWFTLATSDPLPVNPLPVKLLSYTATLLSEGTVKFKWECAETVPPGTRFRILRSESGRRDFALDTLLVNGSTSTQFHFSDELEHPGYYTYRLEIEEPVHGKQSGAERAIWWLPYGMEFIRVFPNPATDRISLRWKSGPLPFHVRIVNSLGQQLRVQKMQGSPGVKDYPVDLSGLPAGWYRLEVSRGNIPLAAASVIVCCR